MIEIDLVPGSSFVMPERFSTFAALSAHWAEVAPEKIALTCEGRYTSFAEFERNSNRLANALIARGANVGGHVGILSRNSDIYLELLFGIAKARMVAVPLNWRLAPAELAIVAADAGLDLLFEEAEFVASTDAICAKLDGVPRIALGSGTNLSPEVLAFRAGGSEASLPSAGADDDVLILYTSGTTGTPKGVLQTQQGMLVSPALANAFGERGGCVQSDINLLTTPLFHLAGIGWSLISLGWGATLVVPSLFLMTQLGEIISDHHVTRATVLPAMMPSLLDASDCGVDLSSLRLIGYGASAIPESLLAKMLERFKFGFVQNYGMSEITGNATALPPEAHYQGSPYLLSCGRALPGTQLKIDSPDGEGAGEVLVKSPSLMRGYWNQPETTAKVMRDGWYATGDIGVLDDEGYLFLRDRKKDMIISGGENIYPAEVESALAAHPDVARIAVIGVPSERWGEEPLAFVVRHAEAAMDEADLISFARDVIAGYKIPRRIVFLDDLPVTSLGKVAKEVLRAPYWSGHARRIN